MKTTKYEIRGTTALPYSENHQTPFAVIRPMAAGEKFDNFCGAFKRRADAVKHAAELERRDALLPTDRLKTTTLADYPPITGRPRPTLAAVAPVCSDSWIVDECPDAGGFQTIRIADGSKNGNTDQEPIATAYSSNNARLIAAAPELLAENIKLKAEMLASLNPTAVKPVCADLMENEISDKQRQSYAAAVARRDAEKCGDIKPVCPDLGNGKATAGPWRIAPESAVSNLIETNGHAFNHTRIGCVFGDRPVDRANARLIAASPLLLAALEKSLWRLGELEGSDAANIPGTTQHEARAAIQSAKGGAL